MLRRKYFNRILTGYVLVAFIYTLIFGGYYYIKNAQIMRKDLAHKGEFSLMQVAKNADMKLGLAGETDQRLAGNLFILKFANETEPDYPTRSSIAELLRNDTAILLNKGLTTYITNLSDVVIGRESASRPEEFFSYFGIEKSPSEVSDLLKRNPGPENVVALSAGAEAPAGKNYLILIKLLKADGKGVYSIDVFEPDVLFAIPQTPGTAFILNTPDGYVCSVGKDAAANPEILQPVLNNSRIPGIGEEPLLKGKYMFQSTRSGIYNWSYILTSSTAENTTQSNQLFLLSLGICLVICLVSVVIVLFMARRMYNPIKQLMKTFEEYGEDNTDCHDEIAYISDTVNKIGSTNADLKEKLQNSKAPLQTKFLRDLLYGLLSEAQVSESVDKFKLENHKPPFRVAILELSSYDLLLDVFSKDAILAIKEEIMNFINQQLEGIIVHEVLELDNRKFAIIAHGQNQNSLRSMLMNIIMTVEGSFEVELMATIGKECSQWHKVADSFANALYILENRFAVGWRNAITTMEDLQDTNKDTFYYPLDTERDIIANVVRGRAEEAKKMVAGVLAENLVKRRLSKEKTSAFIFALTGTINRIVESLGKSPDEIFGEGTIAFLDLKMCKTPAQLTDKANELFGTLTDYVIGANKQTEDDIATRLLDYIHTNYNKDISLLDIGGNFNLSQCYVSTLFKEVTGENFKEYLSHYRIGKAKEILAQNPNIKAKDLAAMIGCNTAATLFRMFNKYEGVSPGQYVKKLHGKGESNNAQ